MTSKKSIPSVVCSKQKQPIAFVAKLANELYQLNCNKNKEEANKKLVEIIDYVSSCHIDCTECRSCSHLQGLDFTRAMYIYVHFRKLCGQKRMDISDKERYQALHNMRYYKNSFFDNEPVLPDHEIAKMIALRYPNGDTEYPCPVEWLTVKIVQEAHEDLSVNNNPMTDTNAVFAKDSMDLKKWIRHKTKQDEADA